MPPAGCPEGRCNIYHSINRTTQPTSVLSCMLLLSLIDIAPSSAAGRHGNDGCIARLHQHLYVAASLTISYCCSKYMVIKKASRSGGLAGAERFG